VSTWRTPDAFVWTPDGWVEGRVRAAGRHIAVIEGRQLEADERPDGPFLVPGFIDLHVHGGGGADAMEGEDAVRRLAQFHAAHGTVALAPTTMTAPAAEIAAALRGIDMVRRAPQKGAARVLGAHLEGPFISPGKLGAQPPFSITPDLQLVRSWRALAHIAVATVAPELQGSQALIEALARGGCRVQIGHTLATADEAATALDHGAEGFTHLFNAMSGLDHRAPGAAACALASARWSEVIADLHHVSAMMLIVAHRAIPGLYAVTDATAAAGMPDGSYRVGRHKVTKRSERVVMADGRLAGSALTMDQALRNLVAAGLSLRDALAMVSARPAAYLGLGDLGDIREGSAASFVLLDEGLKVTRVWVDGTPVESAA
jgi:N-acetylglucosamine-6-phosphate deacetylase